MPSFGRNDLIASYWTIAGGGFDGRPSPHTIADRAAASASAGFAAIGLRHDDFIAAREAGFSPAQVRSAIDSACIALVELEFISGWSSDDEAIRANARPLKRSSTWLPTPWAVRR